MKCSNFIAIKHILVHSLHWCLLLVFFLKPTVTIFLFHVIFFPPRYQKEEESKEREALLSRNFTTNDADTAIMMDHSLQQNQNLYSANKEVGEMLNSGSDILSNLKEQRMTLKGAHKKILDVANTLGLSNTVLRLIERRTTQDKFILYGGMMFTCVIMFLVWKYLT